MKMFRGLVLGGPSDGAIMEFDAPYRRVAIIRDCEPIIYPAANLSALTSHQELETLTYRHKSFLGVGFWVPEDWVMDPGEPWDRKVLVHLSRVYRPVISMQGKL